MWGNLKMAISRAKGNGGLKKEKFTKDNLKMEQDDDERHGQGTYTFLDGEKYVGEWKDGKEHGQGTYTSTNGDKYVGEHKDGKEHGQGTKTHSDGKIEKGIWENGKLTKNEESN